jgi:hypothetical protein
VGKSASRHFLIENPKSPAAKRHCLAWPREVPLRTLKPAIQTGPLGIRKSKIENRNCFPYPTSCRGNVGQPLLLVGSACHQGFDGVSTSTDSFKQLHASPIARSVRV